MFEAAIEKLHLKQKDFIDLEEKVSPITLLASNASALSIDSLVSSLRYRGQVVEIHFFSAFASQTLDRQTHEVFFNV